MLWEEGIWTKKTKQKTLNIAGEGGGKQQSYSPYSCQKIIEMNISSSDDLHGRPFQMLERNKLQTMLLEKGLIKRDYGSLLFS